MLDLRADQPSYCAYYLARAYSRSGDARSAMRWLTQAMNWGYPKLEEARTDKALASLHGRADFNDVMGIVDASKMSRAQGWRYDLAFLARYIKVRTYHPFKTTTGDRFISRARYTESQFDEQVRRIEREIPRLSNVQIELAFMHLIANLGDGHTELGLGPGPEYTHTLPLKFESFADGLFNHSCGTGAAESARRASDQLRWALDQRRFLDHGALPQPRQRQLDRSVSTPVFSLSRLVERSWAREPYRSRDAAPQGAEREH